MFKKFVSVLLTLLLVCSLCTVVAIGSGAAEAPAVSGDGNVFYFDTTSSGWSGYSYIYCHIFVYGGDAFYEWQTKKERCTDNGDGTWTYDLDAKGVDLQAGVVYCIMFSEDSSAKSETYQMLMDTSCIGDTAYATGNLIENPVDSSKTSYETLWKNADSSVYGPLLAITSIGNVVGTACAPDTTPYAMFVDFLTNTLDNARTYSGKTDQQLIDDVAAGLGLSTEDIIAAINEAGVTVDWNPPVAPTEAPIPTEAPTEAPIPTEAPTEAPVPTEAPTEAPVPTEAPTEAPVPTEAPTEEPVPIGSDYFLVGSFTEWKVLPEYNLSHNENEDGADEYVITVELSAGDTFKVCNGDQSAWYPDGMGNDCVAEFSGEYTIFCRPNGDGHDDWIKDQSGKPVLYVSADIPPVPDKLGDVDGDGVVSVLDATKIQKYIAQILTEKDINLSVADVDGDTFVSVMDATRIQKFIAQICNLDGSTPYVPAVDA